MMLSTFILFINFSTTSYAAPLYYTFEGQVTNIQDSTNDSSNNDIYLGSYIQHTLLLDFELDGYHIQNDDSIFYEYDSSFEYEGTLTNTNIFYAEHISGTTFIESTASTLYKGSFYGQENVWTTLETGEWIDSLNILEVSNRLDISSVSKAISDWAVGDDFLFYNRWTNSTNPHYKNYIEGNVQLTNISTISPVPLPPSFILFLTGLIFVFRLKRKIKGVG